MSQGRARITDTLDKEDESEGKIIKDIRKLNEALDSEIPPKSLDSNLLIATWNIKVFGGLTDRWESDDSDDLRRDLHSLLCIAEIVKRFDVIAIQEVVASAKALRHLMKALGPDWGLLMTDITKGNRGNEERLAFVFDTRRVSLSGLAGEIVIPPEEMDLRYRRLLREQAQLAAGEEERKTKHNWESVKYTLSLQFARTPYAVGFISRGKTFVLITLHVRFKGGKRERLPELYAIAEWLGDWAMDINSWEHNLLTLGDFNIDRVNDVYYKAFTTNGLDVHPHFRNLPRTIFDVGKDPNIMKFYDQIAWFTGKDDKPALSMKFLKGGYFNFLGRVLTNRNLTSEQLQHYISDHFPLWAEFEVKETEEEDIPKVPDELTEDQKRRKEEDSEERYALGRTITSIENAISEFLYKIDSKGWDMDEAAEDYFTSQAYHKRTLDRLTENIISAPDLESKLMVLSVPSEVARKVSDKVIEIVEAEQRGDNDDTTEEDVKRTVKKDHVKKAFKIDGLWPLRSK